MKIGTIKETKDNENRVGLNPQSVSTLINNGHEVFVEKNAGNGAGFEDNDYKTLGATILDSPLEVVKNIDVLVKVKEPLEDEYPLLAHMKNKFLYTYLHLSGAHKDLTLELLKNKITGIAYETIEDEDKKLVCLCPMSKVAGILAVQYASQYLQKKYGGRGLTMGHIRGSDVANVVIMGHGIVGKKSALMACGMGAKVTLFGRNENRVTYVKDECSKILSGKFFSNLSVEVADEKNLSLAIKEADVLIGAVLVRGAKATKVVSKEMVDTMKKGAVIIDVSIDQGGCIWGAKVTSHSDPIYDNEGKIYCCIPNMPGQASLQATQALNSATLPYLIHLANKGLEAFREDPGFLKGINTHDGYICYEAVAKDLDLIENYRKFE